MTACLLKRFVRSGSVGEDSAENLIDGADGVQSLRLDGRKVCSIKKADISQVKRNKATVCALPSIHLPLTREARVIVLFVG